jgi:hypothetical protein
MRLLALVCVLTVTGCYDSTLTGQVDSTTDVPEDTGIDTSLDGETDTAADTATDTTTDVPMDVPVDGDCTPHMGVTSSFEISGFPSGWDINVELVCDLLESREDPEGSWSMMLACHSDEGLIEQHELTFRSDPYLPYPYPPTTDLWLRYVHMSSWPGSKWFTLRASGESLVAAGVQAWSLVPPGYDTIEWYSPMNVSLGAGRCPIEETDCGPFQRVHVHFAQGGEWVTLLDGSWGEVGNLMISYGIINVQDAWQYHELYCDGAPPTWIQYGLVNPPSM